MPFSFFYFSLFFSIVLVSSRTFPFRFRSFVEATKNKEESCSFLDAIGRRSCGPLSRLAKKNIDRLGGKVAGYVHLCRTLAFRPNMHAMAIRRFFVAFIRPRLEYCSAVWCGASPALLKDVEKVQLRVARAIVRNTTLQDVSTLQQARLPTLSWRRREHCLGLLWQLSIGKGPPALQASLVPCAQLRSTRFPHSFRFPSASSSRHLSSFLCQTVPIWNRLPSSVISSTSLSSFRSAVRRHFVSDMFTYGLS